MAVKITEAVKRAEQIPGYMTATELTWLASQARGLKPGAAWAELGCLCGRSLLAVGLALPSGAILLSVDLQWGSTTRAGIDAHDVFRELASARGRELELHAIRGDTAQVFDCYRDWSLDVVFIDADHSYEATARTIRDWLSKLKPGGLLCGHDYSQSWPGVVQAVDEAFACQTVERSGSIWSVRVG